MLVEIIDKYLKDNQEVVNDNYFHPSSISKCAMQIYLLKKNGDTPIITNPEIIRIMNNGTYSHLRMQDYLARMDVLYGSWYNKTTKEVINGMYNYSKVKSMYPDANFEYSETSFIDTDYNIKGKCDGFIKLDGKRYLLEFKTINDYGFKGLYKPKIEHTEQAELYLYMYNKIYSEKYGRVDSIIFLYENKNDQKLKEFHYTSDYDTLQFVLSRIKSIQVALDGGELPEMDCKKEIDSKCRYASFCRKILDGTN